MVETCIDPYLKDLYRIQRFVRRPQVVGKVGDFIVELRILKMFLWCLARWDDSDVEIGVTLAYMVADIEGIWVKFGEEAWDLFTPNPSQEKRYPYDSDDEAIGKQLVSDLLFPQGGLWEERMGPIGWNRWDVDRDPDRGHVWELVSAEPGQEEDVGWDLFPAKPVQDKDDDWELLALCLERTIQQCKLRIEGYGRFLLLCSLRECSNVSHISSNVGHDFIFEFLDAIQENLEDIIRYKADKIAGKMKKIEIHLLEKVTLLFNFLVLIANGSMDCEDLTHFNINLNTFANHAACLTFLCWVKEADEKGTTELNGVFSAMLQKFIKPCVPEGGLLYFRALKVIKLHQSDTLLLGRTVSNFVDLHLEILVYHLKDDFQIIRDGLIFLLTFQVDPPQGCGKDEKLVLIRNEIDVLLSEASYLLLRLEDTKDDFVNEKMFLSGFVTRIELLKAKITQLYVKFPDSSSCDFPTNGLGFFIFLLQHLKKLKKKLNNDATFIPFAKHYIVKIEKELASLRPYFNDIVKLQKVHEDLEDICLQMIHLAYLAEYVVDSCTIILHPIWYNMACLSDILEKIKAIKRKLKKIKDPSMYNSRVLSESVWSSSMLAEHTCYSRNNDVVVGLEKDADVIISKLTRGFESLDIVSIVGMGGLGKTTLAQKVYNAELVRRDFSIFAFCSVSQVHNTRKILLDILNDIIGFNDKIHHMQEDDLAHLLWKSLSGRKYLIVIDDIWDIGAWNRVKYSFPDSKNRSRVLFTTRNRKVALDAKSKCCPHFLRFLTKDESWELLQKTVFRNEGCPPDLIEVGKQIAENCNGLPLAVVVIAGILARPGGSLSLWTKIAEATRSYASKEGCTDILELSYKCLPEYLKPCFLSFGVFEEDALISAKRLMLLWMGEGFVLKSRTESVETLAKEYLSDLVDRSLVIVAKRSSRGGIKECRVHDIIYDFCQNKAREENFFQVVNGSMGSSPSNCNLYSGYRVVVKMNWESLIDVVNTGKNIHSLLYCSNQNLYGARDFDSTQPDLRNLKRVKVLDLERVFLQGPFSDPSTSVLSQVTSLVNLQYIAISCREWIFVPSSISNLWNLEILIVKKPGRVWLPKTLWKMNRLGHVEVGRCELDFGSNEHEPHLQLKNLESFSRPTISVENWKQLLLRLPNVRKLGCYLDRSWDLSCHCDELLLLDFLSKLESLKLYSTVRGQNLSVRLPLTLKKLQLGGFRVSSVHLSAIQKLPCLVVLKIEGFSAPRWEMEDAEFPNLKFLKLLGIPLVEWNPSVDTFPCLEQLVLIGCRDLKEIPACFGEIPTLNRIEVRDCKYAANSAIQIQKEQEESGNVLELVVPKSALKSGNTYQSQKERQYLERLREFVERNN